MRLLGERLDGAERSHRVAELTGLAVSKSGVHAADSIFMTCCALHNWLLFVDGLDDCWEDGIASDWEGELGEVRQDDLRSYDEDEESDVEDETLQQQHFVQLPAELPDALYRLNNPVPRRDYAGGNCDDAGVVPTAPMVAGVPIQNENNNDAPRIRIGTAERPQKVRELTLAVFRAKLITHFDIAYKRNEIVWPRRTRQPQPPVMAFA